MTDTAAVIIGATGGIGRALADGVEGSGRFTVVHRFARSTRGIGHLDLEDEATIAAAAAKVAMGPAPTLVFIATGVLQQGFEPERSYKAMTAGHLC
jgi:hypothetical protein